MKAVGNEEIFSFNLSCFTSMVCHVRQSFI